jgi:hypothetical protein
LGDNARGSAIVNVADTQVHMNEYSIQNLGTRMLILYWYQSQTRIVGMNICPRYYWRETLRLPAARVVHVRIMLTEGDANERASFASVVIIPRVERCLGHD